MNFHCPVGAKLLRAIRTLHNGRGRNRTYTGPTPEVLSLISFPIEYPSDMTANNRSECGFGIPRFGGIEVSHFFVQLSVPGWIRTSDVCPYGSGPSSLCLRPTRRTDTRVYYYIEVLLLKCFDFTTPSCSESLVAFAESRYAFATFAGPRRSQASHPASESCRHSRQRRYSPRLSSYP